MGCAELLPATAPVNAVPSLSFEQYGATAGGPIMKDKLFWFVGYEAQLLNLGITTPISAPVDAAIGDPTKKHRGRLQRNRPSQRVTPLSAQLAGPPGGQLHPCAHLRYERKRVRDKSRHSVL